MKTKSNSKVLLKVLNQLKGYRLLFCISILLSIVSVGLNLVVPVIFGIIIDGLIGAGQVNIESVLTNLFIIGVCILSNCIIQWIIGLINNKITYNVAKDVRNKAFCNIQRLPLSYVDNHAVGDVVSRTVADVEQFTDGLLIGFSQLFTGVLTILGTIVIMFLMNWIVALIVVVVTPVSLFVARFIANRTYSLFRKTSEIKGEQTAFIEEMISNLKVVKAFNREDDNIKKFDEINERLTDASLKSIFYSSLTNPSTRFVNSIVYALVALSGALILINPTSIAVGFSVGKLSAMLNYANQYTKPFNEISSVITELQNALACAGRIYDLIEQQQEVSDENNSTIEHPNGNIKFEDVSFSYIPTKKLIQNVSLDVSSGQKVAIVGPTGCGKTTLINLLMRFYDVNSGAIYVDDHKLTELKRKSLRSNIGMVLQDTWLKKGTIRENIAYANPSATLDEVISAAKSAHAHSFIVQLKNGYDTIIEEGGDNLSQGQKQLLCIARVMLCLPPMLILDEATSSIDVRTEMKIQNAFNAMMKGRTTFIVAHRLSTIQGADVILVMKDGNVIEKGSHAELLAQDGFYKSLYNSQFAI